MRGVETDRVGGGLVTDLPLEPFRTDPDHVWVRCPVEIVLNDRQERSLLDAGLMPLSSIPFSEELVFGAVRSLLTPQRHIGTERECGRRQCASVHADQLDPVRIALRAPPEDEGPPHGRLVQDSQRDRALPAGLADDNTVNGNLASSGDSRARFPLVAGRVSVNELPGKPGSFGCVVHLQPHYQLDDISAAFQLVTDLSGR